MPIPFLTKSKVEKQALINSAEAFHLWDILKSKYAAMEKFQVWGNFIHDVDLVAYVDDYIANIKSEASELEEMLQQFGITGPDTHTIASRTSMNSDIIRDELVANDVFILVQENIQMLLRAIESSTTNDQVRATFVKFAKDGIDRIDFIMKYLKLKGWLGTPPMFRTGDPSKKVDTGEAFGLWSHLTYRYQNLQLTEIMSSFAKDAELLAYLGLGRRKLEQQVKKLEQELQYFAIVLPVKPPTVSPPQESTDIVNDAFLFKTIYSGISAAMSIHAKTLKQSTTNDRIRNLFADLLVDEIAALDKSLKFGKTKGWLDAAPSFGVFKMN